MPAAFLCLIEREIAGLWVQSTGRLFFVLDGISVGAYLLYCREASST